MHAWQRGALLAVLAVSFAEAQVPKLLNYQGKLSDANGNPVTASAEPVVFTIVDGNGSSLWTESQSVAVTNGLFSVQLGAVNPVPASIFSGATTYLQVQVNGELLSPNRRLVASPYAENAQLVQGKDFGLIYTDTVNGRVGIGSAAPGQKLDVAGGSVRSDTGFCIGASCVTNWSQAGPGSQWTTSGSNIYNANAGNVGIGTNNPTTFFQISSTTASSAIVAQINGYNGNGGTGSVLQLNGDIAGPGAALLSLQNTNPAGFAGGGYLLYAHTGLANHIVNDALTQGGALGIGTTAPGGMLAIAQDRSGTGEPTAQLTLTGATNPDILLAMGLDTTNLYGWIQSTQSGVGPEALSLQPNGGDVGIGTTGPGAILQVNAPSTYSSGNTVQINGYNGNGGTGTVLQVNGDIAGTGTTLMSLQNTNPAASGGSGYLLSATTGRGGTSVTSVITQGGLWGLGTSTPTALLSIQGQGVGGSYTLFASTDPAGSVGNLVVAKSGNVGIGSGSPQATLDVSGSESVSGNVTVKGQVSMGYQQVSNQCVNTLPCTASCPSGTQLTGGGCYANTNGSATMLDNNPTSTNSWYCYWNTPSGTWTAYAICARIQ